MHAVSKESQGKATDAQATSDEELVANVLQGDLASFDRLVGRYQRRATGIAYRLLNNRDDALEVTQDAFLRAYDRLSSLSNPARFGSWLLRIVSNLSLNRRRSRALRRAASIDAPTRAGEDEGEWVLPDTHSPTPLEEASGGDLKDLLSRAIDELPELQRQALILFSIEKMPQKEVAEILDCSVEAVKWHVFTARKKLKEQLTDFL